MAAALLGRAIGLGVMLLGGMALSLPLVSHADGAFVLGLLMLATAAAQIAYVYLTLRAGQRRPRFTGTATTVITGLLLVSASKLVFTALAALLGLSWIIDGLVKGARAWRGSRSTSRAALLFDGAVSLLVGLAIAIQWPISGAWTVYLAAGLRILATGWSMMIGRFGDTSDAPPTTEAPDPLRQEILEQDLRRSRIDRRWILTLLVVFFAIHVGRMEADWTLVGLFSPLVAVIGDMFFALFISYALVVPTRLALTLVTQPLHTRFSSRFGGARSGLIAGITRAWTRRRTRFELQLQGIRKSPAAGLHFGLRAGLPATAVLVAFAPLLGISWYFNTETWATGAWDHWAAHRTDDWREEMVAATTRAAALRGIPDDAVFRVDPGPTGPSEDFSFIVIGDTGEGDASQHVLRDQFLQLGERPDVKFLVISSDVIYPQGAMKDYESKFYLPFKGFSKPIYAIPGNHDWYDALEAFNANFLEPEYARIAMHARREADRRLTSTTAGRIEQMLSEAASLRSEYGIRAAQQRAPFFEIQTPHFALIAVDTGILREIDPLQIQWLNAALKRSVGKFIMALPGHPLYAAGRHTVAEADPFAAFHALCREHGVRLVMAGDTHDLEVYHERYEHAQATQSMLHIVNGGGGAYLSLGTALSWPKTPDLRDCAYYPRTDAITAKLNSEVSGWKWPVWWWTRTLGAWPSSAEALAAAFASNRAPFYQSFCEIRVEPSSRKVRVRPYGANGRLKWREMQLVGTMPPGAADGDGFVEWSIDMP